MAKKQSIDDIGMNKQKPKNIGPSRKPGIRGFPKGVTPGSTPKPVSKPGRVKKQIESITVVRRRK